MTAFCIMGLIDHKWRRVRHIDTGNGRCPTCKHDYDLEVLHDPQHCPRCGGTIKPKYYHTRICIECGITG